MTPKLGIYGISLKSFCTVIFVAGMFVGCWLSTTFPKEADLFMSTSKTVVSAALKEVLKWTDQPNASEGKTPTVAPPSIPGLDLGDNSK